MKKYTYSHSILLFLLAVFTAFAVAGCGTNEDLDTLIYPKKLKSNINNLGEANDYYNRFFDMMASKKRIIRGTSDLRALDSLPKDGLGRVNWTIAVVDGYINPRGSIDPKNDKEDPPLNLNIFFEAKTPLMANVLFPHSIHTYWLSCNDCHPKIFIPEAGANPVSMEEIWQGKWCGRCHGKVAFDIFQPRANCVRCHIVLKGQSLERERWK